MKNSLNLSSSFSLPLETVTQAIAILAKRRAGKSYLAMKFVEQLHRAGQQVVVLDPKGDSWGIRFGADGKSPGLPIVIIGGEHGDVKLEAGAGEIVARLIVEDRICAVIDLSEFRKHEVATFSTAFLETVYRLKAKERFRTPLMLVIDEADQIAPQRPMPGEQRMLGAAEDIVRRGGQRGIGCMMATQRAAVLNKNVLTQVQMMIALRTIAPQDLDAMNAWIDVHGTTEQRKRLMSSLPSLPVGTAWFWSPGWPTAEGIFECVQVGRRETHDSGATPKAGERPVELKGRAEVDLASLSEKMQATIARSKATDPKELQRRIVELERELTKEKAQAPVVAVPEVVHVPGIRSNELLELADLAQSLVTRIEDLRRRECTITSGAAPAKVVARLSQALPRNFSPPQSRSQKVTPALAPGGSALNSGQRRILTVLAQNGGTATKRKVALIAGYALGGGGFNNNLSALRTNGLIAGSNELSLTDQGSIALGEYEEIPTGPAALQHWIDRLGKAESTILLVLNDNGPELDKEQIAEVAGYAPNGGGFNNALSRLRTLELISGSRTIELSEDLR